MRKQYHLLKSEKGLLAWDVHRLIELTKDLPIQLIALDDIKEIDESYWFNDAPTCRKIAEHITLITEADLSYPIILSSEGRVMDGMHRVIKALLNKDKHIKAVQLKTNPSPDYIGVAEEDLPY
ncbi:hypothetical protein [Dysgonomonas sp. HGC4]|uniref:hypothetical protein n=1 Tax=Dysgonomonas sp. HGC4 TaxID=1658009 RepID=UPI000681DDCF|nr:hypothetical protein [Dysgonomonas sp. HGC4]MBD8349544.1 hypothetical protein [Dysgonomonas sp. HGC4]